MSDVGDHRRSQAASGSANGVPTSARRREYVTATAALLVIACLWFWPLLAGRQLTQSYELFSRAPWLGSGQLREPPARGIFPDAERAFHPWTEVMRDQLRHGHLPLWNPYEYGGTTLIGNVQSALFFPLTWALLALPFGYGWGLVAVAKVLLAGLGAYALSRELRTSRGGALLAGTVYMLSGPMMAWLQWPLATVYAVFPWLLLATVRVGRGGGPRAATGVALAVALTIFAGHPESALIALSAAGSFVIALVALERGLRGRRAHVLGWWALGALLGVVAASVVVVPFAEALQASVTGDYHGERLHLKLPVSRSLAYVMPDLFGNGEPHVYGASYFQSVAAYFGLPALVLALVGLIRHRRAPAALALAVMAVLAAMAAYGIPPVTWVVQAVPPWSKTLFAERADFVIALAGAVGAGAGLTTLSRRPLGARQIAWLVGGSAVLIALGLGLSEWRHVLATPASAEWRAAWISAAGLVAAAGLLALVGRVRPRLAVGLALAVAILSLIQFQNLNVWLPPGDAYPPRPPAVDVLRSQPESFRVGVLRAPDAAEVMPPNTLALYGLEGVEGYDFPLSRDWSNFQTFALNFPGLMPESTIARAPPLPAALQAMRMVNVRYYLAGPDARRPYRSFETVYRGPGATVFRDPGAMPRAWVVARTRALPQIEALAELARGTLNPRREALVPPGTPAPPAKADDGFRPERVEAVAPDHVRVHLSPGSAGWLVLANAYSPTWKAEVDGEDAELRQTNFATMGVPVSHSARVVDFRLDRTGFWVGAALSVTSLLAIAGLALFGRSQSWRQRSPG